MAIDSQEKAYPKLKLFWGGQVLQWSVSIKSVQGRNSSELVIYMGTDGSPVWSSGQTTVAQTADNGIFDKKVSEYMMHHSLLHMELQK